MKSINFVKMTASGNDFVVIRHSGNINLGFNRLAKDICDRKYGAGADGLLVLVKTGSADIRMRIFNADGSEAEMCGNGARCVAWYAKKSGLSKNGRMFIETKSGIIESTVNNDNIKIKLTDPRDIKNDILLKLNNRNLRVNFINTGVPHAVIFSEGLDKIDIFSLGRQIRFHKKFFPRGTNVDFVEITAKNALKVRTYERGVEDETFACGTGSVAAALLTALKLKYPDGDSMINVVTKSRETLKVYFTKLKNKFQDVWLEGKAKIVYKGAYYV